MLAGVVTEDRFANLPEFIKNLWLNDSPGALVVALVKREDRASTSRMAQALKAESARIAPQEEMLEMSGSSVGGQSIKEKW